ELLARWRRPLEVETKSTPTDPVTNADVQAERAIRELLGRRRPQDSILGEEGGESSGAPTPARQENPARQEELLSSEDKNDNDSDSHYRLRANGKAPALRWIVDPLDGTVNYLYGWPTFAVSVAVEDAAGGIAAVVLDPVRDELFSATRSGRPLRNSETITASGCESLSRALVGTGFGYDAEVRALQAQVAARVIPLARDIRRAGVAALDMCACACGSLDAYYERGVKAWDIAAGTLICRRAGLAVRTLEADGLLPAGVAVAAPALIDELLALVA
ncbi:MAG: inositol monophosphatase family protein, partial [Solirubrobacteraceae bacterium]